ncbi:hypothetical protein LVJ59_14050 [Microbacterium sp. KKR3/1]|uniref:hypothetical protein n=1 Tax=Microbacterium sp. KKR3/1 TaxID=2904241 RepID=UPI001E4D95C2|nr:hypothetical protein [Microbacterium sp. KKR3/1]MCE0510171.1 hypothetical protein [Microbacterium sp. KKR3/1]
MRKIRRSWLLGGIGLISCGIVGIARSSVLGAPGADVILALLSDLLWAGAILLLSIGLSREASVVARSPLGLSASAVVALWPVTATVLGPLVLPQEPTATEAWQIWAYLSVLIPLISGLIAAMQVARARTVPAPWNWAPLWALGVQTIVWVVPQAVGASSPRALIEMAAVLPALGLLGFVASTLGLGIVAVTLAGHRRVNTVPVFESSGPDTPVA